MNVRLAAQTLSSSVANVIEFLDIFAKHQGTVKFILTIDQLFYKFNSRNPIGKGFKAPLRLQSKDTWQKIFSTMVKYLQTLKPNTPTTQLLSTTAHKTFIIGF